MRKLMVTSAVFLAAVSAACNGTTREVEVPEAPPSREQLAQFWIDPGVGRRGLYWGVGGEKHAPPAHARYRFEGKDDLGFSTSYDVTSPDGIEWSAKIGAEAQTEVVLSRVLWGLGYHQPPVYYLPSWNLVTERGDLRKESEARFRPKLDNLEPLDEYWSWQDNPFIGTTPFNGLLVVLLMFNSTDLKDDNNSIYELEAPWAGVPGVRRWFVVRDLGAALGETGKLYPRRNWIDGFEAEEFLEGFEDGRIVFAYSGRHQQLLDMVRPDDLEWAARRLQRLTGPQWNDAFRAANYTDDVRDRYLRKIREKIDEALTLAARAKATPDA